MVLSYAFNVRSSSSEGSTTGGMFFNFIYCLAFLKSRSRSRLDMKNDFFCIVSWRCQPGDARDGNEAVFDKKQKSSIING